MARLLPFASQQPPENLEMPPLVDFAPEMAGRGEICNCSGKGSAPKHIPRRYPCLNSHTSFICKPLYFGKLISNTPARITAKANNCLPEKGSLAYIQPSMTATTGFT